MAISSEFPARENSTVLRCDNLISFAQNGVRVAYTSEGDGWVGRRIMTVYAIASSLNLFYKHDLNWELKWPCGRQPEAWGSGANGTTTTFSIIPAGLSPVARDLNLSCGPTVVNVPSFLTELALVVIQLPFG